MSMQKNMPVVAEHDKNVTSFELVRQETMGGRISINPKEERVTTVIGRNSNLTGDLSFDEGLKLDGRVKGTITFGIADGLCIISKGAVVEGNVCGPRALVLGTIEGDINTSGLLLLAPSAVIVGNVSYGRLIVCEGAQITGGMNVHAPTYSDFKNVEPLPVRSN